MAEPGGDEAYELNPTPEDIERAARPAAIYAEAWFTTRWKGHVRVAFGEVLGVKPHYSAAVVLSLDNAEALGKRLAVLAAEQRKEDAEASKKV